LTVLRLLVGECILDLAPCSFATLTASSPSSVFKWQINK
jgi:hypothetical protein